MAHIPKDDTNDLWNEIKEKNWGALEKTLQAHKGKTNGISDTLVDMMTTTARQMEDKKAPFPGSPEELNKVLNENLPKV